MSPNPKKRLVKVGNKWIARFGTNPARYKRWNREYVDCDYKSKLETKEHRYYVNAFYQEYEGNWYAKDGSDIMHAIEEFRKENGRRNKRRSKDLFYFVRGTSQEVSLDKPKVNTEGRKAQIDEIDAATLSIEDLLIAKMDLKDEDLIWKLTQYEGPVSWWYHDSEFAKDKRHSMFVPEEFRLTSEQIEKLIKYLMEGKD